MDPAPPLQAFSLASSGSISLSARSEPLGRLLLGETPKAADIPGSLAVILGVLLVLLA